MVLNWSQALGRALMAMAASNTEGVTPVPPLATDASVLVCPVERREGITAAAAWIILLGPL